MSKKKEHISISAFSDISYDQRMQRICDALSAHGYAVSLYCRYTRSISDNYAIHPIPCYFKKGILAYAEFNIRLFLKLLSTRADIFSFVDLDTALPNWIISRLKHKKLVYDAHEYYVESPEITSRPLVQWIWQGIARLVIPRVDNAYTVNIPLAKELKRRYKKSFDVVKNVPYNLLVEPGVAEPLSDYSILYQGVVNVGRGLEEMICAMPSLSWAKLIIVGDGDIKSHLQKKVLDENIVNVQFLEKRNPEVLRTITRQAWLGINLLDISNQNYYYSLANKYFDYMQAHIPCISMNTPAYKALNKEYRTSILVDDLQVSTIVNAIENLKSDPLLYDQLRSETKKAAEVYHWENEIPKLLSIYR